MLTRQEMFDRAYRGMASQGFQPCAQNEDDGNWCLYTSADGTMHCAWGWVDTSLTYSQNGGFGTLRSDGIGLAAKIAEEDVQFVKDLQAAHDLTRRFQYSLDFNERQCRPAAEIAAEMKSSMIEFAKSYGLFVPELS